jgi:hypothetical protein
MSPPTQFCYDGATGWCAPHTLSTILTASAARGKLSLLGLASSPGAFTAPQMARRLRSARLSPSSAIHSASPAAPSRCGKSRCWLRASILSKPQ